MRVLVRLVLKVSRQVIAKFLGFENAIHFDKKDKTKAVCKYYDRYIRNIYKSVFENVLSKGIIENWTFEKYLKYWNGS